MYYISISVVTLPVTTGLKFDIENTKKTNPDTNPNYTVQRKIAIINLLMFLALASSVDISIFPT